MGQSFDGVLLPSAARTADATTEWKSSQGSKYLILIVDCTADPASAAVTPKIQGLDPASGKTFDVWAAAAAVEAVGMTQYMLGPALDAAAPGANTDTENVVLPPTWRLFMEAADTDSLTYSVGYAMID